jgi:hypothetical protein
MHIAAGRTTAAVRSGADDCGVTTAGFSSCCYGRCRSSSEPSEAKVASLPFSPGSRGRSHRAGLARPTSLRESTFRAIGGLDADRSVHREAMRFRWRGLAGVTMQAGSAERLSRSDALVGLQVVAGTRLSLPERRVGAAGRRHSPDSHLAVAGVHPALVSDYLPFRSSRLSHQEFRWPPHPPMNRAFPAP